MLSQCTLHSSSSSFLRVVDRDTLDRESAVIKFLPVTWIMLKLNLSNHSQNLCTLGGRSSSALDLRRVMRCFLSVHNVKPSPVR